MPRVRALLILTLIVGIRAHADLKSWLSSSKAPSPSIELSLETALRKSLGQSYDAVDRTPLIKAALPLFKGLSPQQVDQALTVLGLAEVHKENVGYLGEVLYNRTQARFRIRQSLVLHPFSNMVLLHEISHLSRLRLSMAGKIERLDDEILAFGAQYDFMRANYQMRDIDPLRERMMIKVDTPSAWILQREGLIDDNAKLVNLTPALEARLQQDPTLKVKFERYISADFDFKLMKEIEKAYRFPKDDYIQFQLGSSPAYIAMGAKPITCEDRLNRPTR